MTRSDATSLPPPRQVLILSDDPLTRSGLLSLLRGDPGLEAILPDERGADGLASVTRPTADAVLWDVSHGRSMAEEVRALAAAGIGVVALVDADGERGFARAAGALGVLPRSVGEAMLIAAIHAVSAGLAVSDADAARSSPNAEGLMAGLEAPTARELEVLRLIAEGLPNKAIAARLGIRESTVKDHVNALLGKLGAQSRTEAVTIALRQGLISI